MQVYSPTGPVTRDYDDVRRFQEAAEKGLKRLLSFSCETLVNGVIQYSILYYIKLIPNTERILIIQTDRSVAHFSCNFACVADIMKLLFCSC